MNVNSLINQVFADHEQGRREYDEMSAEIKVERERIKESIAEKRQRFDERRANRQKDFNLIRR